MPAVDQVDQVDHSSAVTAEEVGLKKVVAAVALNPQDEEAKSGLPAQAQAQEVDKEMGLEVDEEVVPSKPSVCVFNLRHSLVAFETTSTMTTTRKTMKMKNHIQLQHVLSMPPADLFDEPLLCLPPVQYVDNGLFFFQQHGQ